MNLERTLLPIIRGEKKAPLVKTGLAGLSTLYRLLITARHLAYDRGLFNTSQLSVPVISVGNVTVGGTGKTPFVHLLASSLQAKLQLAILTRGYRSQIEKKGEIKCISTGQGPLFSPEECGDEPYFLAQKTLAAVWVGADRVASGQQAINAGAKCLLLDDGMQHRRLKRDFEIVILDASDPFSRGRFLPWGLLRDSPTRLKQANLIVVNHLQDEEHYKKLQRMLAPITTAPLIGMQIEVKNKTAFFPRKVGVFCGIGQPARFLQTVRDLKSEIVDTFIANDHGSLPPGQLQAFAERCHHKGAEALLCTEKDYVKLSLERNVHLNIVPIEIQLKIVAGEGHWQELIENILQKVDR